MFLALPAIVISVILLYAIFLFKQSYRWVNIVNLTLDGIILIYYSLKFCRDVVFDKKGITLITIPKKYRVPKEQIKGAVYTSFLTKIITENGSFYVLTSSKERYILESLIKDVKNSP